MSAFIAAANLVEKASGSDRHVDRAIAEALGERCGRFGYADEEEEIAACYTASLDQAVKIVPTDWYWQVGYTTSFQAWANVYKMHPDHTIDDVDEFKSNRPHYDTRKWTPVLALLHAALRARASLVIAPPDAGDRG